MNQGYALRRIPCVIVSIDRLPLSSGSLSFLFFSNRKRPSLHLDRFL